MLLVLDSNEYIFAFGIHSQPVCSTLLKTILDNYPKYSIRVPRTIINEVHCHISAERFRELLELISSLTSIDEDFIVPFELGAKYEMKGLKQADAFIAAYVEWTGAKILVTENRHFLRRNTSLPFKVLNAEDCLEIIKSI